MHWVSCWYINNIHTQHCLQIILISIVILLPSYLVIYLMDENRLQYIMLLKSEEPDKLQKSKYEELLSANHYNVDNINTLVFEYGNLDKLLNCLKNPEEYSGMFFASPRCVNAVSMAFIYERQSGQLDPRWKTLTNFVVGNQTFQTAMEKLQLECKGKETGNANNLADFIMRGPPNKKPLLVPHGNLKTNLFKERLSGHTALHEIMVYEINESPDIIQDIEGAINRRKRFPDYIVFFSPSGVNAAFSTLTQKIQSEQVRLIAIGPTTALSMTEKGLKLFKTLDEPTPENLLKALQ